MAETLFLFSSYLLSATVAYLSVTGPPRFVDETLRPDGERV